MTSQQFSEWLAYAAVRGMPEERADFRAAQLCAVLANCHRNPEKVPEPFKVLDFIPQRADDADDETQAEEVDVYELSEQLRKMLGKKE